MVATAEMLWAVLEAEKRAVLKLEKAMSAHMRAKLRVWSVQQMTNRDGSVFGETLRMHAVARNDGYPDDGSDENNTFAKFSPSASFDIDIRNPALFGKFAIGEEYYVDFTPAGQPAQAQV